jgi:hypothetical protein
MNWVPLWCPIAHIENDKGSSKFYANNWKEKKKRLHPKDPTSKYDMSHMRQDGRINRKCLPGFQLLLLIMLKITEVVYVSIDTSTEYSSLKNLYSIRSDWLQYILRDPVSSNEFEEWKLAAIYYIKTRKKFQSDDQIMHMDIWSSQISNFAYTVSCLTV